MTGDRPLADQLTARESGGVLWLTLDRPEAANAVTPDQRDRLIELLADAGERVEVRAVVLTATGRHFCTGADLRNQRPGPDRPEAAPDRVVGDVSRMIQRGAQRMVTAVLDCDKPVIAAVNGTAAGIGAHLALACDLVVAAEGARFIEVFVRRGLVPDGAGCWLLARLVGLHKAKELMLWATRSRRGGPAPRAGQPGRAGRRAARRSRASGRPPGRGSDPAPGADEGPAQPVARQRQGRRCATRRWPRSST